MSVKERLVRYVSYDTQSDETSLSVPSTAKQLVLADALKDECMAMGFDSVERDEFGVVYAVLEATAPNLDSVGFISHMDTALEMSGANIKWRQIWSYDGKDIVLNQDWVMNPSMFETLNDSIGHDLIVTDGTTLLGADDKAGIAIIMQSLEEVISEKKPHGKIFVAFTPDEEIGRGVDHFDLERFCPKYAYTVDGDRPDSIDYETFNAAKAIVTFKGNAIHPGSAKGKMVNAALLAGQFMSMMPKDMVPEKTEGYEGFYHLLEMKGECENASLYYLIRNHDMELFENQKQEMIHLVDSINEKYPDSTTIVITDQYYNLSSFMKGDTSTVDLAKRAIEQAGMKSVSIPIRGGTDGAMLSAKGLICPNLGTGSYNHHSRFEYADIEQMETLVKVVKNIIYGV